MVTRKEVAYAEVAHRLSQNSNSALWLTVCLALPASRLSPDTFRLRHRRLGLSRIFAEIGRQTGCGRDARRAYVGNPALWRAWRGDCIRCQRDTPGPRLWVKRVQLRLITAGVHRDSVTALRTRVSTAHSVPRPAREDSQIGRHIEMLGMIGIDRDGMDGNIGEGGGDSVDRLPCPACRAFPDMRAAEFSVGGISDAGICRVEREPSQNPAWSTEGHTLSPCRFGLVLAMDESVVSPDQDAIGIGRCDCDGAHTAMFAEASDPPAATGLRRRWSARSIDPPPTLGSLGSITKGGMKRKLL